MYLFEGSILIWYAITQTCIQISNHKDIAQIPLWTYKKHPLWNPHRKIMKYLLCKYLVFSCSCYTGMSLYCSVLCKYLLYSCSCYTGMSLYCSVLCKYLVYSCSCYTGMSLYCSVLDSTLVFNSSIPVIEFIFPIPFWETSSQYKNVQLLNQAAWIKNSPWNSLVGSRPSRFLPDRSVTYFTDSSSTNK